MNVTQFIDKIGRTKDGEPVITLMTDPTMTDDNGNPGAFVSLVGAGANLQTYQVVKSADLAERPGEVGQSLADGKADSVFARFLQAVGLGSLVTKARKEQAKPLTFNAAIVAERLRRARWEATDALWDVIRNILKAQDVTDKPAAISATLDQFKAHVMALVNATVAMQAGDQVVVVKALALGRPGPEEPAPGTTSPGQDGPSPLDELIGESGTHQRTAKAAPAAATQEETVNHADIKTLAETAAVSAIKAAKAAGITDPGQLAKVGITASQEVYKAAVAGPAQPAMPTNELQRQIAEAAGSNGTASDPFSMFNQTLNQGQIRALTMKLDKVDELDKALNGHGEGDDRTPGLLEVVSKMAEGFDGFSSQVAKALNIPEAPRAATEVTTDDDPDGKNGKGKVTKSEDTTPTHDAFNFLGN